MASTTLTKTFGSTGNRKIFTISTWLKRASTARNFILSTYEGSGFTDSNALNLSFDTSGIISIETGSSSLRQTSAVYRDVSAWYHLVLAVDTTQATASNRLKLYINGSEVTSFTTNNNVAQNTDMAWNHIWLHRIGASSGSSLYFDGSMASFYSIDGQALTPSSFGETDATTGIWKPKSYSGSYGTNGFFLKFENSGSLGTDSSGNGNNFTVNGTPTQTVDTPTNNFAILNTLDNQSGSGSGSLANGNTYVAYSGGTYNTRSTIGMTKGKWYWEVKAVSGIQTGFIGARIGFMDLNDSYNNSALNSMEGASFAMYTHPTSGLARCVNGANTTVDANLTYTNSDIISVALDCDSNIGYWYRNGSLISTYDFSAYASVGQYILTPTLSNGSGNSTPTYALNYGNGYFQTTAVSGNYADGAGYGKFQYQPRTGHYAMCTRNLNTYG